MTVCVAGSRRGKSIADISWFIIIMCVILFFIAAGEGWCTDSALALFSCPMSQQFVSSVGART